MQQHGPWQIVQSQAIYRDPWIAVRKDDVIRPDGQPGTFSLVHLKPGVSVLAMNEQRQVYLTEAVRRVLHSEITHGPSAVLILKVHLMLFEQSPGESGLPEPSTAQKSNYG